MKNWYCEPASKEEAVEIVKRAEANGAYLEYVVLGMGIYGNGVDFDCYKFWGVYDGKTMTHDAPDGVGEQLTIQQVREKFPLPNEIKKEWQGPQDGLPTYTHEFSDVGVRKKCTIVTDKTDSDGFILIEDAFAKYHLVQKRKVVTIRTERDKWVEQAVIHATKEGYINEELAFFIARKIYDNMIKEAE